MTIAYVLVTVLTIVANGGIAAADLAGAEFVRANAAEVGVRAKWIPLLGTLKAAGAAGLLLGLFGATAIGVVAAVGLVLFFAGALAAHIRSRVFHNIAFPGAYAALAVASLVLLLAQ